MSFARSLHLVYADNWMLCSALTDTHVTQQQQHSNALHLGAATLGAAIMTAWSHHDNDTTVMAEQDAAIALRALVS